MEVYNNNPNNIEELKAVADERARFGEAIADSLPEFDRALLEDSLKKANLLDMLGIDTQERHTKGTPTSLVMEFVGTGEHGPVHGENMIDSLQKEFNAILEKAAVGEI